MASVIKRAPVGSGIVGIGDREVIAMSRAAEVDHAAAVVANFKQQPRMILAQLGMDVVISPHRMVAHVGGVGAIHPVPTP